MADTEDRTALDRVSEDEAAEALASDLSSEGHVGAARIGSLDEAIEYAFAGRARMRTVSIRTQVSVDLLFQYRTRPSTARARRRFLAASQRRWTPRFYVYAPGPVYLGTVFPGGDRLLTNFTRGDGETTKRAAWIVDGMLRRWHGMPTPGELPTGVELWHCGTCGMCGRLLRDPVSVETGFGPICRHKRDPLLQRKDTTTLVLPDFRGKERTFFVRPMMAVAWDAVASEVDTTDWSGRIDAAAMDRVFDLFPDCKAGEALVAGHIARRVCQLPELQRDAMIEGIGSIIRAS